MAERRLFVRLCTAGALAYCSHAICRSPLLPLFAQDLGAGPEAVGLIAAASTVTGVFLKLPAWALSDVLGCARRLTAGGRPQAGQFLLNGTLTAVTFRAIGRAVVLLAVMLLWLSRHWQRKRGRESFVG
jgi:hypothetical protein